MRKVIIAIFYLLEVIGICYILYLFCTVSYIYCSCVSEVTKLMPNGKKKKKKGIVQAQISLRIILTGYVTHSAVSPHQQIKPGCISISVSCLMIMLVCVCFF